MRKGYTAPRISFNLKKRAEHGTNLANLLCCRIRAYGPEYVGSSVVGL
jgi:hypothetical protein